MNLPENFDKILPVKLNFGSIQRAIKSTMYILVLSNMDLEINR